VLVPVPVLVLVVVLVVVALVLAVVVLVPVLVLVLVQDESLSRQLHVGDCPRKLLRNQSGIGGFVGARSGSFFVEIFVEMSMSDVFFVNLELRDRYGDVGHHLPVQDAPSFIQKYMKLIRFWSLHLYTFQERSCFS
jgi:hypothetical protein